jgi:hypothetical protein
VRARQSGACLLQQTEVEWLLIAGSVGVHAPRGLESRQTWEKAVVCTPMDSISVLIVCDA